MNSLLVLLIGIALQETPQFEVASIKPSSAGPGPTMIETPPSGRVNIVNATFKMLVRTAYRFQDYQVIGGRAG